MDLKEFINTRNRDILLRIGVLESYCEYGIEPPAFIAMQLLVILLAGFIYLFFIIGKSNMIVHLLKSHYR